MRISPLPKILSFLPTILSLFPKILIILASDHSFICEITRTMRFAFCLFLLAAPLAQSQPHVQLGPRPFYLVEQMRPSALKDQLGKSIFWVHIWQQKKREALTSLFIPLSYNLTFQLLAPKKPIFTLSLTSRLVTVVQPCSFRNTLSNLTLPPLSREPVLSSVMSLSPRTESLSAATRNAISTLLRTS